MSFNISFPESNTNLSLNNTLNIHTQEFNHEIVSFTLDSSLISPRKYKTGTQVVIDYGDDTGGIRFHGYVDHVIPSTQKIRSSLDFICVGPSWTLKEKLQKVYKNNTVPGVVKLVANKYGFSLDTKPHPTVWPMLPQHGNSTFEFLVELAKRIGYTFTVKDTEIRFLPRVGDISDIKRKQANIIDVNSIKTFESVVGNTGSVSKRVIQGINPRTNEIVSSNHKGQYSNILGAIGGKPRHAAYETDLVAHDLGRANAHVSGRAESTRFHINADVEMISNVNIHAGSYVYINTDEVRHAGMWFVESAEHILGVKRISYLKLGRDSEGDAGDAPDSNGKIILFDKNSPTGRPRRTPVPTVVKTVPVPSVNVSTRIPISPARANISYDESYSDVTTNISVNESTENQWQAAWTPDSEDTFDAPKITYVVAQTGAYRY